MAQPLSIPPSFETLPVHQQLEYVQALWKRIGEQRQDIPSPAWHRDVVRERLAEYQANPDDAKPWEDVRGELLTRFDNR